MSVKPCSQNKGCYNYNFLAPTQTKDTQLAIKQSDEENLKVSVVTPTEAIPVQNCWLENLPDQSRIPKEFFDACKKEVVNLSPNEVKVKFTFGLKGGGNATSIPVDKESKAVVLAIRKISERGFLGIGGAWTLSREKREDYTQQIIQYLDSNSTTSRLKENTYVDTALEALRDQANFFNVGENIKRLTRNALKRLEKNRA